MKIEIGNIINKKFRKCLAIGALATSLVVSPIGDYINIGNSVVADAKSKKKKKKVKLVVKRAKNNKKTRTFESGKTYKEKYSIKLKNGKKKFKAKKYSIIIREKDKVLKVTPKEGIDNYSKLYGVERKFIKKGKKMSGTKVKYIVDPNVKMKLQEKITILCTYIKNGKKHVKKKKIKNIRFIEGNDYNMPLSTQTPEPTPTIPPQEEVDKIYEEETGDKLHIVYTPAPIPTFNPDTSVIEEDPRDETYYDNNGNVISSPEPLPTVKPTMAPNATPVPTETPIETTHNGMTIISDATSYEIAEENLLNQTYGDGIVLNSIDPTINTLYFNAESGLIENSSYLDYLNLNAKDANGNDITNNVKIYDYHLKQAKENDIVSPIIIEVRDNNGNLYSQYLNISTKNINDPMDMPTGSVVVSEDEIYQTYYDMYLLSIDPVIFAKTDNIMMDKESIIKATEEINNTNSLSLK